MREIKFRAYYQRVTDDEWVIEGEYTLKDLTDRGINFDQVRIEWVQFTGLKDKNGKEIYEGDILQYGETIYITQYNFSRYIMYDPEFAGVDSFGMPLVGPSFSKNKMRDIEIIGNIYENPEWVA